MDKNSFSYWYPWLVESGVATPKTRLYHATDDEQRALLRALDGDQSYTDLLQQFFFSLRKIIRDEFNLPVFLRTGHTSGKHWWDHTCYLENLDDLPLRVHRLMQFSLMQMPMLPWGEWVIREYIPVRTRFRAFSGRMPITNEWRYFIGGGDVLCRHPYWPWEALAHQYVSVTKDRAKEVVEAMATRMYPELADKSKHVALHLHREKEDEAWSLDWMQGKDGVWYAIDMALAKESYHDPECPHRFGE